MTKASNFWPFPDKKTKRKAGNLSLLLLEQFQKFVLCPGKKTKRKAGNLSLLLE
jgi:hypothetical protein